MTTQAAAGGFNALCPCGWHGWSGSRETAEALLVAHECEKES